MPLICRKNSDTAAFIGASSLDVPDTAFMNGGTLTGSSNAKVVNLGTISSSGGYLAHPTLWRSECRVGKRTERHGRIRVTPPVVLFGSSSSRRILVQIGRKDTVAGRGTTQAAHINLQVADGNICRLAGSGSQIGATGTAARDGHIWPVAGDGHVTHQRTIPARNVDTLANTPDRQLRAQCRQSRHS